MRMLAFCRKRKRKRNNPSAVARDYGLAHAVGQRGFTLLEILVVLVMVGLLSALALPQFSVIRDRLEFSLNRESFERELSGLAYRAFTEGRPLVLSGQYPRDPREVARTSLADETSPAAALQAILEPGQYRVLQPILADDAPLTLPKDWRLTADNPVVYQVSGFCGGGSVNLTVGKQRYVYSLKAPECRVELVR